MTHYSQIPEKPLVAGFSNKVEDVRKIYFFQKENGEVFAVQSDEEAWQLWNRRNQIIGRETDRVKLIGTGDGKIFNEAVIESRELFKESGLEAAQERIRRGEQEELNACKGNVVPPPNMDYYGSGADYLRTHGL